MNKPWHEDPLFWTSFAPIMFDSNRWSRSSDEVDKIIELLDLAPLDMILDACCGVGRHSVELSKRGFKVTGVDITEPFIEAAQETADAEGVSVDFIVQDIRTFLCPVCFDAAINMYTSFGYFEREEENEQALRNILLSLKTGGKLLLEVMGKEIIASQFKDNEWYEYDDMLFLAEHEIIDNWSRMRNRWILIRGTERFEYVFSHRIYSSAELQSLLYRIGFSKVTVFGSLNKAAYDRNADQMIVLAVK